MLGQLDPTGFYSLCSRKQGRGKILVCHNRVGLIQGLQDEVGRAGGAEQSQSLLDLGFQIQRQVRPDVKIRAARQHRQGLVC